MAKPKVKAKKKVVVEEQDVLQPEEEVTETPVEEVRSKSEDSFHEGEEVSQKIVEKNDQTNTEHIT